MASAVLLRKVVKEGELKMLCGQTFKMLKTHIPYSVREKKKWLNSLAK